MINLKKQFVKHELNACHLTDFLPSQEYENEQILYEGTPFFITEFILKFLSPIDNRTIYDLGSGYGRFVLYGAINYPSTQFKGIELITERLTISQYYQEIIRLHNATFIKGNVLNIDFSDGDIFFLFNPFSYETLTQVKFNLKGLSQLKSIIIIAIGKVTTYFDKEEWLVCKLKRNFRYKGIDLWNMSIYFSI